MNISQQQFFTFLLEQEILIEIVNVKMDINEAET